MNFPVRPLTDEKPLALSAEEVAKLLGVSERHVWSLNSSGKLPKPIRLGRAVRWSADELRMWLLAGAPRREHWEAIRDAGPQ